MQKMMLLWLALVMNRRGISLLQTAMDVGLDTDGKEVGEHFKTMLSASFPIIIIWLVDCFHNRVY